MGYSEWDTGVQSVRSNAAKQMLLIRYIHVMVERCICSSLEAPSLSKPTKVVSSLPPRAQG